MKRLCRFLQGNGKKPLISCCVFLLLLLAVCFWDDFLRFTDAHPLLRLLLSAEWAIARYRSGARLLNLPYQNFFWFLVIQQCLVWMLWVVVFWKVSPLIAQHRKTKAVLSYLMLQSHEKHVLARLLTGLITWAMRHRRTGKLISHVFFFTFGFVSHMDIPAIAVAIGFRRWSAAGVILAAMISKVIFWSSRYMGYP